VYLYQIEKVMTAKTVTEKARFDTRLPREQKLLFERAASIGGYRNLSDFVILSAQEKANQIIKERETILASERDAGIFFDALMDGVSPNEKLLAASVEYKKATQK
jgi:uncharacterized protein (DUF1778 family)